MHGSKTAIISTVQRAFDGKYISRAEIHTTHRHAGGGRNPLCTEVVFITAAMEDLDESRKQAADYCRECRYKWELNSSVEILPEPVWMERDGDEV